MLIVVYSKEDPDVRFWRDTERLHAEEKSAARCNVKTMWTSRMRAGCGPREGLAKMGRFTIGTLGAKKLGSIP
jgi:hypothetical protein